MTTWVQWMAGEDSTGAESQPLSNCDNIDTHAPKTGSDGDARLVQRWIGLVMSLGLLARIVRYYLCFPLWDDESFLCVNFINRNYAELLGPLDYHQVAPILFLWIERTVVNLLGFSEYTLRLFPFACSIASLFLFRRVAEQLLSGSTGLFAIAIFAVAYPEIRYAAEAKPYCTDMFVSLLMLAVVVEWQRSRSTRLLGWLAIFLPFALGVSYPAVFAAGGLSLVVGGILYHRRGTKYEWAVWWVGNLTLVASFAFWFRIVGAVQSSAESEFMGEYWKLNFPPASEPWRLPYWMLKTHASDFLAYPLGGPNWASSITLVFCTAGLWQFIKRRNALCLGLVLAPAGLHLLAAALQRYPYGGHVKFSQYLAPMICCLAAAGIAQCIEWRSMWSHRAKPLPVNFAWPVALLMLIGCGSIVRDLDSPYKTRSDFRARAFAQSFWVGTHSVEEVVCLKSDLGLDFVPDQHRELSWSAHYLCNRAIEVSRSSLRPARVDGISAARPLRCVLYRDARFALDESSLQSWLSEMQKHYDLVAHESVPFPRMAKDDRRLMTMEYIESYKFVPRPDSAHGLPPLADSRKNQRQ